MNPILGLPVKPIRRPTETSVWVPPSDSGSPLQNWRHSAHNIDQTQDLTGIAGNVNRALAGMTSTFPIDYNMHPFKVYQCPFALDGDDSGYLEYLATLFDITDIWRVLTMRTGLFIENSYGINSSGYFLNPATNEYELCDSGLAGLALTVDEVCLMDGDVLEPSALGVSPNSMAGTSWSGYNSAASIRESGFFEVEDDAISWIWAEIFGWDNDTLSPNYGGITRVDLKCSADPAADGWENYPFQNPYIIPIATVDTTTYREQKTPIIHQIQRGNIIVNPYDKGYFGTIAGAGNTMYSNFGGRGIPLRGLVSNNQASAKGLYASRKWFNNSTSAANFADSTLWVKIADRT